MSMCTSACMYTHTHTHIHTYTCNEQHARAGGTSMWYALSHGDGAARVLHSMLREWKGLAVTCKQIAR